MSELQDLPKIISNPRFETYLNATDGSTVEALQLYKWNLEISSAFIIPLQICEVSVRNAISDAIAFVHGENWPFEEGFHIALNDPRRSYSPRKNIRQLKNYDSTGKVIADLKFAFWQHMFTGRHDNNIWNCHLRTVFPNTCSGKSVQTLRQTGYNTLDNIRKLRNRIAHHEPIFTRDIQKEYDCVRDVISWRSQVAAEWVDKIETVTLKSIEKP